MKYDSPEEERAAFDKYRELEAAESRLWNDLENYRRQLEKMNNDKAWQKAMEVVEAVDQECVQEMVAILVTRGDLSIFQRRFEEYFYTVQFDHREFRCVDWEIGVAKALLWSEKKVEISAEVERLKAEVESA